ncbi:MAG TPA: glycerophosphodiester phosphodiesterase [Nocardioidaceae bacterium]|nr:glycerophosphodiester phosphodiesterase [Nocardioidaceae bacterium]
MAPTRSVPEPSAAFGYLDQAGPLALAHRGGATDEDGLALENSRQAFQAAVALGYRYLETDVHVTRDGVLVSFHDETLDRTTNHTGQIGELPYAQVRAALIAGREPIPTLAELLAAWPDVRWNIDIKSESAIAPLVTLLREADALDRVCVASFSTARLRRARRLLGAQAATAMGPAGVAVLAFVPSRRLRRWLLPAGVPCVQVPPYLPLRGPLRMLRRRTPRLVTARFVRRVHEHGAVVQVWTVNDVATMHRLLDLGVDGIISDRIDILRDVLVARGQWNAARA